MKNGVRPSLEKAKRRTWISSHGSNGKKGLNGRADRKYQTSHPLSRHYRLSGTVYVSRTDCLSEQTRKQPSCSRCFRPSETRKYFERYTGVQVLILESTRRFLKLGRDFSGSVVELVQGREGRCNNTASSLLSKKFVCTTVYDNKW